ncbi:hypothetical protein OU997_08595 [Pseudomonas sp. SL4(2022)]|uniref:hypothetical protein n=1 Tax=Pseudomonas sp. SL4(2022) TaxID=2994661 RepID=UPI0022704E74|nr:hypothetical protein [Pseudomonas sp. SL4(2022)]WAC46202.1 hypothetical protein OU997_08595 [Pseudomonas sp. SL4(2022)]
MLTGHPEGNTRLWPISDGQWRRQSFCGNWGTALMAVAFAQAPGRYCSVLPDGRLLQRQRRTQP